MELARVKYKLNQIVFYNGHEYKLNGCTIRCNEKNNKFYYEAELLDIVTNNSLVICKLSDVKE